LTLTLKSADVMAVEAPFKKLALSQVVVPGLIESVTPMPEAPCALLTVSFCDPGALPPA
jgi:hypothetical protein